MARGQPKVGAAYWESRLSAGEGLSTVGHQALGEPFNAWAYRARGRAFRKVVRPHIGPSGPGRVLDVGSGTGFYIERWRELGAKSITGSDVTEVAVSRLERRYPDHEFLRLDLGAPLDQGRARGFDVVSAMDVLFHLTDDEPYRRAFRNLYAMLEPGGLLVFSDFFSRGETRRGRRWIMRSEAETESAMRAAGLELLDRRPLLYLMNAPAHPGRAHELAWRRLTGALRARPRAGAVLGPAIYPLERALATLARRGPSTQIAVCRRPA